MGLRNEWAAAGLWAIACLGPRPLLAQQNKIAIGVFQLGEDAVGKSLAFAVRDAIRHSASYTLAPTGSQTFSIGLVTIDISTATSSSSSAVSVVFTLANPQPTASTLSGYPLLLNGTVLAVGRSRVPEMADRIVALLDATVLAYNSKVQPGSMPAKVPPPNLDGRWWGVADIEGTHFSIDTLGLKRMTDHVYQLTVRYDHTVIQEGPTAKWDHELWITQVDCKRRMRRPIYGYRYLGVRMTGQGAGNPPDWMSPLAGTAEELVIERICRVARDTSDTRR
jgi:hypothetical protein